MAPWWGPGGPGRVSTGWKPVPREDFRAEESRRISRLQAPRINLPRTTIHRCGAGYSGNLPVLPEEAKPEDKNAKEALESVEYLETLKNYDEKLQGLTEKIWENDYLHV